MPGTRPFTLIVMGEEIALLSHLLDDVRPQRESLPAQLESPTSSEFEYFPLGSNLESEGIDDN